MPARRRFVPFALALALAAPAAARNWPAPSAPALVHAPGYVDIPGVAAPRDPAHVYQALFDATAGATAPDKVVGVLQRVGLQVNGLLQARVPADHIRFAMIFHGPATDALLTDAAYRAKHHVANPNLALVAELKRAGVRFLVCGQYLAGVDVPRGDLIPEADVAEAATLVMIRYQNDGFAFIG